MTAPITSTANSGGGKISARTDEDVAPSQNTHAKAEGPRPTDGGGCDRGEIRGATSGTSSTDPLVTGSLVTSSPAPLVSFRAYQRPVFFDHTTKTQLIHWSRQIGKSYTLAAWAVDRLLRYPGRLVTVLSNSRDNGAEFVIKSQEVCEKLGLAVALESNAAELDARRDLSEDVKFEAMRFEVKITVGGKTGRIKVLAANPRTARGFSGDLILDEFAFHEDSRAIWEAAEPIISSNPDYLCRIASTGNGRRNMFYQLISEGRIPYNRVRRSDAYATGDLKIYSALDGKPITPDEARKQSSDKRAYDQNYECCFEDENSILLSQELISAAQRIQLVPDEQEWSPATLARLYRAEGELYLGQDFARSSDLSVQIVLEKLGPVRRMAGMLLMRNAPTPHQNRQLDAIAALPKFRRCAIDMTGNGTGLYDYAEAAHGTYRIEGVNFGSTEAVSDRLRSDGRKSPTAKVTELMAVDLLALFEERTLEIFTDADLRDDLRKPERITSPGGRVSIAASRDVAGHADRFWALALAVRASNRSGGPFAYEPVAAGRGHRARSVV